MPQCVTLAPSRDAWRRVVQRHHGRQGITGHECRPGRLHYGWYHRVGSNVGSKLFVGIAELLLQQVELVLKDRDQSDTPIDGVTEADLGLVGKGVCCVFSLRHVELAQELGYIARAENLMDVGKLLGLVRGEVWREHAFWGAFPALALARRARRTQ